MKLIIYDAGETISVIIPTGILTIEETAKKNVPTGVKYKIIEHTDLPADREFRNAWEYDFNNSDGVGG